MSKLLLLTDIHFGRKNFHYGTTKTTIDFYNKVIEDENVQEIIILGDVYHNRTMIDWRIFNSANSFFKNIYSKGIKCTILIGNHDTYYKSTIKENSLHYLKDMYNFDIIEEITEKKVHNKKCLFVPWIVNVNDFKMPKGNYEAIFGHFEIKDAYLTKTMKAESGLSINEISKKAKIFSGHFHIKSDVYLGTSEQHSYNDFNEKKGVHILEEDFSLKFIENTIAPKYIYIIIDSTLNKPIRLEGCFLENNIFNTIEEARKEYDFSNDIIKIIIKNDTENIINEVRVYMDIENISYIVQDDTEFEINYTDTEEDYEYDLINIVQTMTNVDKSTKTLFKKLYHSAIDKI